MGCLAHQSCSAHAARISKCEARACEHRLARMTTSTRLLTRALLPTPPQPWPQEKASPCWTKLGTRGCKAGKCQGSPVVASGHCGVHGPAVVGQVLGLDLGKDNNGMLDQTGTLV